MICIDSNILIYAFNESSEFNRQAKNIIKKKIFLEKIAICDISLVEFFQVITDKKRLETSLNTEAAQIIIKTITENDCFKVLYTNREIYNNIFETTNKFSIEKYEIYDHIIACTCKFYNITELITMNVKDFKKYKFLKLTNPFKYTNNG